MEIVLGLIWYTSSSYLIQRNKPFSNSQDSLFCLTIQVLTVTEQLEAGVRYLDFRIAHKSSDPSTNLYFVHMVYTTVIVQVLSLPLELLLIAANFM